MLRQPVMDKTYKMTITAYFRAKDAEEANEIMNAGISVEAWDAYNVNPPVEVYDDRSVGLSE